MHDASNQYVECACIGIGPSNASFAALWHGSNSSKGLGRLTLFDRYEKFEWHPGQLFPESIMQNSFLRDLVTLVDPTNAYSFLNYLNVHGRIMQFVNSGMLLPYREEIVDYVRWALEDIPDIYWQTEVLRVDHDRVNHRFDITVAPVSDLDKVSTVWSDSLVIGIGTEPVPPPATDQVAGLVPISGVLERQMSVEGRDVVVIGAGQSGAEAILDLLQGVERPSRLTWMSRQGNFQVLDTGNISREFYSAPYMVHMSKLSPDVRLGEVETSRSAETGISPTLLETICRAIYYRRHVSAIRWHIELLVNVDVTEVSDDADRARVLYRDTCSNESQAITADVVVWAGGLRPRSPQWLLDLVGIDYSMIPNSMAVHWYGEESNSIYLQPASSSPLGVGAPNFSAMSARNAMIINELNDREVFRINPIDSFATWR